MDPDSSHLYLLALGAGLALVAIATAVAWFSAFGGEETPAGRGKLHPMVFVAVGLAIAAFIGGAILRYLGA
jgi:hypothetical protein